MLTWTCQCLRVAILRTLIPVQKRQCHVAFITFCLLCLFSFCYRCMYVSKKIYLQWAEVTAGFGVRPPFQISFCDEYPISISPIFIFILWQLTLTALLFSFWSWMRNEKQVEYYVLYLFWCRFQWLHVFILFYEFLKHKWLNLFVVVPSFVYFTVFIIFYTKSFTISWFVCCNGALFFFWLKYVFHHHKIDP